MKRIGQELGQNLWQMGRNDKELNRGVWDELDFRQVEMQKELWKNWVRIDKNWARIDKNWARIDMKWERIGDNWNDFEC